MAKLPATPSKNSKPAPAGRGATRSTRASGTSSRGRSASRSKGFPRLPGFLHFGGGSTHKSRPVLIHLSPERKLDILGTGLALLGLLTLLSVLSSNHGTITGAWVDLLAKAFGWGVYLLPLALIGVGLWLILRNIESLPQLAVERLVGMVLIYINALAFFHLFAGGDLVLAEAGIGGGYLGGWILAALVGALGKAGSVVALLAWFLIALTLVLDLSIPELFRWVPPLFRLFKKGWDALMALPFFQNPAEGPASGELFDDFTPISRIQPQPPADESDLPAVPPAPGEPLPVPAGTAATQPVLVWTLPPVEAILDAGVPAASNGEVDQERAQLIEETLKSFGAPGHIVEIHRGPTITQFGLEPDFIETRTGRTRVRVSKIVTLADDLALALAAQRIRIQAPVPGRAYVGIEVPNTEISRVGLREMIEAEAFQKIRSGLRFAIGKDVAGKPIATDLGSMPHLLIAGTTGSGKSVCVNAILSCFLINNTPDDLRMILVDPKRVELTGYNGVPHLLAPVVVDVDRVVGALQWVTREMDNRYHKFAQVGSRNIADYNAKLQAKGEKKIPYLVIVIDELADLMMLAPDETERTITRLAQLARATGIHLILATQRPSVDVLTGLIKANFPARIAFAVASGIDSRVILDQPGAERLLGRGDMLFQAPDAPAPLRLQGAYVSDTEIQRLVEYWRLQAMQNEHPEAVPSEPVDDVPRGVPLKQGALWDEMAAEKDEDPMLKEATDLIRREGRASISMLQRRLRIGYTRAARMIDTLEDKGIVGPTQANSQIRQVLDYGPTVPPKEE